MSLQTVLIVAGIALLVAWRLLFALSCYSISPIHNLGPRWLTKWSQWLAPGNNQPRVSK